MRRIWFVLMVVVLGFAQCAAASDKQPDPKDYPLALHVVKSQYVGETFNLYVTVDGKTLDLATSTSGHTVFFGQWGVVPPGDYRARITHDGLSKRGQFMQRTYEFLWADGTRETYYLAGISE